MSVTVLRGGALVTPGGLFCGDLALGQGKILQIAPQIATNPGDAVVDVRGCIVFPGFIDAHTHLDMVSSNLHTADDFRSGTLAALMGGTTTVIDFATQERGGTLTDALTAWHNLADGNCSSNYAFHMAVTDWNEAVCRELPSIIDEGITGFKAYMTYDQLMLSDDALEALLTALKPLGGILGIHCEDHIMLQKNRQRVLAAGITSPAGHPLSRPPEAEAEAIARLCKIAQKVDAPVHIVHLSSRLGLEEIRRARQQGLTVYAETCPQYLLLEESRYQLPNGEKYVMSPPLRSPDDVAALRQAVIDGEIHTISSDHCSFYLQDKQKACNFTEIPNGIPGTEHRVSLMLSSFQGKLSYMQLLQLMSENAAKLFHLYPQKGALLPGSDADITVWDPNPTWTITAKNQHQKADYTPYEGIQVTGKVRHVFLGGIHTVRDGALITPLAGKFVKQKIT